MRRLFCPQRPLESGRRLPRTQPPSTQLLGLEHKWRPEVKAALEERSSHSEAERGPWCVPSHPVPGLWRWCWSSSVVQPRWLRRWSPAFTPLRPTRLTRNAQRPSLPPSSSHPTPGWFLWSSPAVPALSSLLFAPDHHVKHLVTRPPRLSHQTLCSPERGSTQPKTRQGLFWASASSSGPRCLGPLSSLEMLLVLIVLWQWRNLKTKIEFFPNRPYANQNADEMITKVHLGSRLKPDLPATT